MADRQDAGAYSALLVTEDFAGLQARFIQNYDLLEAGGYPNLAQLLRSAFFRFRTDLEEVARETAKKAALYIREEEVRSRVRPDSGGGLDGIRMEDYLGESAPLSAVPGSVGINFEPSLYDNVPWWWTNEEGYSGHIGRVVHGFFYESGFTNASAPDPGSSREHPLFRAEGPQRDSNSFGPDHGRQSPRLGGRGERPGMRIENPIPAREFVRLGLARAEGEWHAGFARAKARFDKELARITALVGVRAP